MRDDEGSVLLLTIALAAVALLLVAVVVDVSAIALAHRSVASVADGAALAAAQQADQERIASDGLGNTLPLEPQGVREAVSRYGVEARRDQPGLRLTVTVTQHDEALVVATRTVALPFRGWFGVREWKVQAVARAQSRVR